MQEASLVEYDSGLEPNEHEAVMTSFNAVAVNLNELLAKAKTITVEDPDDTETMQLARSTRLELRAIKTSVEKTRKAAKAASLLKGKAIDGFAAILQNEIVPAIERLQEQEDFAKRIEADRIASLVLERTAKLEAVGVDCQHYNLSAMDDQSFVDLLEASTRIYEVRIKVEQEAKERAEKDAAEQAKKDKAEADKIEAERKAKEEADRIEREKVEAENARLRQAAKEREEKDAKEQAEREKVAKAEREKREKAEAEAAKLKKAAADKAAKEKADADKAEREREQAELKRLKDEKEAEQARLAAPDAEKLQRICDDICGLDMPSLSSEVGMSAIVAVRGKLNGIVIGLRVAIDALEGSE